MKYIYFFFLKRINDIQIQNMTLNEIFVSVVNTKDDIEIGVNCVVTLINQWEVIPFPARPLYFLTWLHDVVFKPLTFVLYKPF